MSRSTIAITAFIILMVTTVTVVVIAAPYLIVGFICAVVLRQTLWAPPQITGNQEQENEVLPLKPTTRALPPSKEA